MYPQQNEDLPHDLVLSIRRILDLKPSPEDDPLDTVGDGFNVIDVINAYFPDGAFVLEATANWITKGSMLFIT
jgi:hypothetical protein